MPRVNITDEIVRMRAEDQSAAAFRSMQSNIAGVKASVDGLKTAFGALGIGLSAGILLNFAREAIRATAILDDMAESTGASVETLSALQRVARVGGHDFEGLTGAIARMVKGLREGDEEGNKAARALEYLGVEARDSTGAFRDQGQVFIEIARASQKYRGTAEGLAIIQDALGKGAEKYISYLADVAEGTDLLNERTREQITEAEKAQKAMNRLGVEISEVFSKSVIDALPQLNSLMESLRQIVGWFDQWREAIVRTEKAWDEFARQFIPWRQQQQQQPGRVAEGMIGGAPSQPPGGGVAGGENYLDYTKRLKAEEEARKTAKAEAERAAKEWAAWLKHREDMVRDAIKKEGEIRVAAEEKALEEMLKYNEQREEEIRDAREKTLQHNNDRGEYWTELRIKREEDYQKAVEAAEERHAQEVLDIRRKAAEAQTAAYQREWERTADAIENALANAIMQGGKSGLELFTRAMRTALLTPIISALVRPLAESIAGAINYGISSAGVGPGAGGAGGQGAAMYGMGGSAWSWRTPPIYHEEGSYASTGGGFNYGGAAAVGLMGLGAAQQYRRAGQSQDPAGEKQTAALTGIGTAIGAFWGPVGAMAGGAIGGMIGGMLGGDGAAMRTGQWVGGLGTGGGVGQQNWFGTDMAKALADFQKQQAMAEQNLVRNLNITSEQQAAINARLAQQTGRFEFGMEWTPVEQSGAFQQISQARVAAIADELGRSMEELTSIMQLSAEQWAAAIKQMEQAAEGAEKNVRDFANSLPEALGITQLEEYRKALEVSPTLSPLDQLAAARGQYEELLGRARAGEKEAIFGFPEAAQTLLGIGRDVYASGTGFQDLFREVNTSLQTVLDQQREEQAKLMTGLEVSIVDLRESWLEELRATKTALVDQLEAVRTELRRMQQAA